MEEIPDYSKLSLEEQIKLVKENGYSIKFIKNPCLEVQLEAVKEDVYSIEYIKNPYLEVQLEAIKQNGGSIKYINNPYLEVQLEAVNSCKFKWSLNTIKPHITNQDALEYWELKYLLLEE